MEQEHQFIDYIEQSIIKNWDKDALTDYKGITLQYKDVARKIAKSRRKVTLQRKKEYKRKLVEW